MGVYIDRDKLLELYANTDELDISNYDVKVAVIRQNILDMPTVDIVGCSEGEWLSVKLIDDDSDFNEVDGVRCSVCGETYDEHWNAMGDALVGIFTDAVLEAFNLGTEYPDAHVSAEEDE